MFRNLFAAEWLKLRRWPVAWALLGAFLGLMLLALALWALVLALHAGLIGRSRLTALNAAQLAQIERQLSFPGIFGTVLGHINGTGGLFAIFLAAGSLGGDYSWGTLRTLLVRAPARGTYLFAKLAALLMGLLVATLIALTLGTLVALIASAWLHLPSQMTVGALLALPLGIGRALFVILPYLLATLASAAWGRSVLAGVGGGMIFLAIDVGAGSFGSLSHLNDLTRLLVNLLLQPNINTLVMENAALFGLNQGVLVSSLDLTQLPSPLQATVVISVYGLLFAYGAWRSLVKRDVTGAP